MKPINGSHYTSTVSRARRFRHPSSNNGNVIRGATKKSFLRRLRWALLFLSLTMGTAMFYMLQLAHYTSLKDSSHVSLSLLNSRQTLNSAGAGGGPPPVLSAEEEEKEKLEEDPEEEEQERQLRQQLKEQRELEPKTEKRTEYQPKLAKSDEHAKIIQAKPKQEQKMDSDNTSKQLPHHEIPERKPKNTFTDKAQPQETQQDLQQNNEQQYLPDDSEEHQKHLQEQAARRREAALKEFENSAPKVENHGQRGGEAAVSVGDPFHKEDLDAASPAKVKAIKAALALDQSKREEAAKEEKEQEKLLAADPERKARVKKQQSPLQAAMVKERGRLWDIYSEAVVQLESPKVRKELDPLYVESIHTPIDQLYRVPFEPKVPYLGVLVDAGRHYFEMSWWKQLIVYLYKLKFNLIQLRLTDDQTFNVQLESYPKLATPVVLGDKKDKKVYTTQELRELVAFAKSYNIRLVPEINVPGHAGAWAGIPDLVVMCPEFICAIGYGLPLNVEHPEIKTILKGVLKEILDIFDNPPFLHLGGDEVNMADPCFAEVGRKPFNYTGFESNLKGILKELNYPVDQVIRWERTGQTLSLERAGDIEHFWQSLPGLEAPMNKYPNGEYKPWIMSRGLYFDTNHDDDGTSIYRYVQSYYHQKGDIPPPKAIVAGTFELGQEFWRQRNVATRLIATVMGAADSTPHKNFTRVFNTTCLDLGIDSRWCNLQGNTATLFQDYQIEHQKTWKEWKNGICDRLTQREMKLTIKDHKSTRNALESTAYNIFWEYFGEDMPLDIVPTDALKEHQKASDKVPLEDHAVPTTGVIFDMVNSLETPLTQAYDFLRDFIAPLGFKTLQLRLVDDHGFAIKLETQPKLGYTALKQQSRISIPEADDYRKFAVSAMKELGIRIIPEITLSTNSGGWVHSGFAARCPQILCQKGNGIATDIAEPGFLPVVYSVIRELQNIFSSSFFHLGHDDRRAALDGCLKEAGKSEDDLALFEEKLATLVGFLNITRSQILRWENQEGLVYKDRTGDITHYKARKSSADLPNVQSGETFFATVDLLQQSPWDIYEKTRALVKLQPKGILGEVRDISEDARRKKNVGLRLVAFAMGLERAGSDLKDEKAFHKALVGACKASNISGCENPNGTKERVVYEVEMSRYTDRMCAEFTYNSIGWVPRENIV